MKLLITVCPFTNCCVGDIHFIFKHNWRQPRGMCTLTSLPNVSDTCISPSEPAISHLSCLCESGVTTSYSAARVPYQHFVAPTIQFDPADALLPFPSSPLPTDRPPGI